LRNNLPARNDLEKLHSLHDIDLFDLNTKQVVDLSSQSLNIRSNYFSPNSFHNLKQSNSLLSNSGNSFSILHNNVRSLRLNLEKFQCHLLAELDYEFDIIGITETKITSSNEPLSFNLNIPNYSFEYVPTPLSSGGVGMYINNSLNYTILEKKTCEAYQSMWIEIQQKNKKNIICGIIYRQHNNPNDFLSYFNQKIEEYSTSGKLLYVLGDFNIDLLKFETCNFSKDFVLSLQSCYLFPTIDKPTRVYNNSATLIDNIFTNSIEYGLISGNIISDISDHYSQFCITALDSRHNAPINRKIRTYSKNAKIQFTKELQKINLEEIIDKAQNIDEKFSLFYRKINKIVNKVAPIKTLSKRMAKKFSKPWITTGIRESIKVKNDLFANGNRTRYLYYRNKLVTLIRNSKKSYFESFFDDNTKNMKKTWSAINSLLHSKRNKAKSITALKDRKLNGQKNYDPTKLPSILNDFFVNVGKNHAEKIPKPKVDFTEYLKHVDQLNSFFFAPVTETEIETEITILPDNKAYGLYSCPVIFLKASRHILSEHLAKLMNLSVKTGRYPTKLKISKIIPVYKADDDSEPSNYRPISLLSVFNRIFEKTMYNRLMLFIENHRLLSSIQYGFRKKHSTHHAIHDIINNIQTNLDNKTFTCAIFIDLAKAFDTVDHRILLKKLYIYGIRGCAHDWFRSYLSGRTQTISIGDNISEKKEITYGVPQGSVLGPLLFLLYINDIYKCSNVLKFHLFADDTNILYSNKNLKNLEIVINNELLKLQDWFIANKLTINIKKSNYVLYTPLSKKRLDQINIRFFDCLNNQFINLENKKCVKYLGVLIDNELSWNSHIDFLSNKVSRVVGILSKLKHFLPKYVLINIYKTLLQPLLLYGLTIWGQANKSTKDRLLILQKRALRIIFNLKYTQSAVPLFIETGILPLPLLYINSLSLLMYDTAKQTAPSNICALFNYAKEIHHHNTRSSSRNNFFIKHSRINLQKNSFSRVGAKVWNQIPAHIRDMSKSSFRSEIKSLLLKSLIVNGYYAEINEIFNT